LNIVDSLGYSFDASELSQSSSELSATNVLSFVLLLLNESLNSAKSALIFIIRLLIFDSGSTLNPFNIEKKTLKFENKSKRLIIQF